MNKLILVLISLAVLVACSSNEAALEDFNSLEKGDAVTYINTNDEEIEGEVYVQGKDKDGRFLYVLDDNGNPVGDRIRLEDIK